MIDEKRERVREGMSERGVNEGMMDEGRRGRSEIGGGSE